MRTKTTYGSPADPKVPQLVSRAVSDASPDPPEQPPGGFLPSFCLLEATSRSGAVLPREPQFGGAYYERLYLLRLMVAAVYGHTHNFRPKQAQQLMDKLPRPTTLHPHPARINS